MPFCFSPLILFERDFLHILRFPSNRSTNFSWRISTRIYRLTDYKEGVEAIRYGFEAVGEAGRIKRLAEPTCEAPFIASLPKRVFRGAT
jgi:hypothetical protein